MLVTIPDMSIEAEYLTGLSNTTSVCVEIFLSTFILHLRCIGVLGKDWVGTKVQLLSEQSCKAYNIGASIMMGQ